jgi:ParB family chromosome partitioning protein
MLMDIKQVSVDQIEAQDLIRPISDEKLEDLAKSISSIGIIEPLIVAHSGEMFKLIAGQRRLKAAKMCSLPTVPCIIVNADHEMAIAISMHENLQREDLNSVDEAHLYAYLRDKLKYASAKIARMVGKSEPYISQHLALLTYLPEIILALRKCEISFSVARELSNITDRNHALYLLRHAVEDGATQRMVRFWVQSWRSSKVQREEPGPDDEPLPLVTDYKPPKVACAVCGEYFEHVKLTTWLVCPGCVRLCTKPQNT